MKHLFMIFIIWGCKSPKNEKTELYINITSSQNYSFVKAEITVNDDTCFCERRFFDKAGDYIISVKAPKINYKGKITLKPFQIRQLNFDTYTGKISL